MKLAFAAAIVLLLAGCTGPRASVDEEPDRQFGHRFEGEAPDGRRTITIASPLGGDVSHSYLPASYESVTVRPAPLAAASDSVAVEVLVKGALPDACIELSAFKQERAGNLINAALEMRRPEGAVCVSVSRPYRLYLMLDGVYAQGNYTLTLNGRAIPFEVRWREEE